ncbi:MAG: L-threonylcarbamoyladenylate synthase [Candidatus Woesearchaeota archaeon]|jgi:L-threonylcarbamoyladenylate synthase
MKTISKKEFLEQEDLYLGKIKSGTIFIYPTDTIYGIGCNALINNQIKKIRELKGRPTAPFSIIAPSIEWIRENCIITPEAQEWVDKLPGPYTLILNLKNPEFLSKDIVGDSSAVGVRLPNHWIAKVVQDLGYPIVTTSVNKKGEAFMTCMGDLDPEIEQQTDLIIHEGELAGRPSKIVHLEGNEEKVISR